MLYFWISILCLSPVWAHQSLLSGNDNHVKWTRPHVPLVIKLEKKDQPHESALDLLNTIENSVTEWNRYSDVKVIPNSGSDSKNTLSFQSNFRYGPAVLGVTEISHDESGTIQSAKILINNDHYFSTRSGLFYTKFLGDVVTHELGHFLGLGHSEVLDSTMFYTSFKGHHTLAADDIAGVRGKYQDYNFGKISGTVKGGDHVGILGTHVQAISRNTGKAIGAISKENGDFEITGLDINDTYFLYTAPLKKPENSPDYFSNSQKAFCPGAYEGSFFSECGDENKGKPAGISLTGLNPEMNVGVVTINCGYKTDLVYTGMKNAGDSAPIDMRTQAFAGWFSHRQKGVDSKPDVFNVNLENVFEGFQWKSDLVLRVSLVAHPFGSELDYKLNVSPSNVTSVPISGTNNLISEVNLNSTLKNYTVSITSRRHEYNDYSDLFPILSDGKLPLPFPYLLTLGLYEKIGGRYIPYMNTEARLSDNSSCLEGPFAKPVPATRTQIAKLTSNDTEMATPSCGSVDPPSGSGPGASLMMMTIGFLLSLLASSGLNSRKKFLS